MKPAPPVIAVQSIDEVVAIQDKDQRLAAPATPVRSFADVTQIQDPATQRAAYLKLRDSYQPFSDEQVDLIRRELKHLNDKDVELRMWKHTPGETMFAVGTSGRNQGVTDLSPLAGLKASQVSLRHLTDLKDYSFLKGSTVRQLDLMGCTSFSDVSVINSIEGLNHLILDETGISNLRPLSIDNPMEYVSLEGCRALWSLNGIGGMTIESLNASDCWRLDDINAVGEVKGLEKLNLSETPILSLMPLRGLELTELDIRDCEKLRSLAGLEQMDSLQTLHLSVNGQIDAEEVRRIQRLLPNLTIPGVDLLAKAPIDEPKAGPDPKPKPEPVDDNVPLVRNVKELLEIKSGADRLKAYYKLRDSLEPYSNDQKELIRWAFIESNNAQEVNFQLNQYNDAYTLAFLDRSLRDRPSTTDAITDLSALSGLKFASLSFYGCKNLKDFRPIGKMTIARLTLDSSGITDLGHLNGVAGLLYLDLGETGITSFRGLKLESLDALDVSACENLVSLDGLEDMSIKSLTASRCEKLKDFSALRKIKGLETLILDNTAFRDLRYISGLDLKTLNLNGCKNLTALGTLTKMNSLERLYLYGTGISERELDGLRKALPNTRISG